MSVGKRVEDRERACALESLAPLGQVNQSPKLSPGRVVSMREEGLSSEDLRARWPVFLSTEPREAIKEFPFHNRLYTHPSDGRLEG